MTYKLYHELPFEGYDNFHRKGTVQRAEHIAGALGGVEGKRGLDIGCAEGGISFVLQSKGASMIGVDNDKRALDLAISLEAKHRVGVRFVNMTVPSDDFSEMLAAGFDFIVWLANFMWIVHQNDYETALSVMDEVSKATDHLIFETAQTKSDGVAGPSQPFNSVNDVEAMLLDFYPNVTNTGVPVQGWNNRSVFYAWRD